MKKTRQKYLWKTIQKNGVSFFAVAFIAAVSIAIFLGLQSAATAILEETGRYFQNNKLSSFQITCANGITPEDIEAVNDWDGVETAEGGYSAMVLMDSEREKITLQALSLSEVQNIPVVVEGELPTQKDQAAVEEIFAKAKKIAVGDKITLLHDGELKEETFEVTAIINQPAFCCAKIKDSRGIASAGLGSAAYYIALPKDAFDGSYYQDCYPRVSVRCGELDALYYYGETYKEAEEKLLAEFEDLGEERAKLRFDSLQEEADELIEAAEALGMEAPDIKVEQKDWIVSGRNDMGDVRAVKTIVDGIYGLSYSMSVIFLLVAVVVCHAAISRMIEDQRSLIGAQKALGFRSGEVLRYYLLYNGLCAALGVALGWSVSVLIVENLVLAIFTPEFLIGSISLTFAYQEALVVAAICFGIFLVTAYVTCRKLVRLEATTLLRGEVPMRGKKFFFENFKCYQKLNLYSRTMIKNVLSDKARMMTTIMGVVGCISLLVICFSLKLAIEDSSVLHFEKYFLYENRLVIDSSEGEAKAFEQILQEEGISYTLIQDKLKNVRIDGGIWENGHVVTAHDFDTLKEFMVLEDIETKETAAIPENGLLVSRKYAQDNALTKGSMVEVMDAEGNSRAFQVEGVIEHYLPYHLFVTTESCYEEMMQEEVDESVFLLKGSIEGLYDKVRNVEGFLSLKDNSEFAANADAINMVIAICLVLSAVLALLVLLNQIVMHINRKSKELAVMRINGYTLQETRAYIYKDNIVLTLLGLVLGCGFGVGLSYLVVRIIETGANRYVRTPNLPACFYACCVGALFAFVVNMIALRRIKHLNLTNVNGN